MVCNERVELVVVAGGTTAAAADGVERVIGRICAEQPGTAVLHHDLREVGHGVVRRRLWLEGANHIAALELAHGCVSCTLRDDALSLLRELGRRREVRRIVLHLDPALEPRSVCWTVLNVLVDGSAVTDAVELRGVITVLDAGTWLAEQRVTQRRLVPLLDHERTIGQLVVGQAEFADLLVYAGAAEPWQLARTSAVLARLAPLAPRLLLAEVDHRVLLAQLPPGARRGRPDHPHAALLRGQPPLHADAGVQLVTFTAREPFHPERLHKALDVLLDGTVRSRGRIWLATRPEATLWLESAGGGLQIGHAGHWLAAGGADAWQHADPEQRTLASLRWHDRWGDRAQEFMILVQDTDPDDIDAALRAALLTDVELAAGETTWRHYPDPFGCRHTDPCPNAHSAGSAGLSSSQ